MTAWLNVGKIVNTHGIKGEVRVISRTDFHEERYKAGNTLYVEMPDSGELYEVTVKHHRKHKQFDLLQFEGHNNVNDVERYKGALLKIRTEQLGELEDNEFYYHEVIGCRVVDEAGEEIGRIKEILSPGANDVWVVQRKGERDLLIPYIEGVVLHVDIRQQIVKIHLMEGLL
ncbi:ribosome maturation factor RimM [Bacillus marinisedimentorum]|uniref:ribosome maturation factor RimM n=1 Tax=Bacillus marinisedimentorum TaxID=1821260 RepID=UPI0007E10246|nr:ribosome maturation factor RimM [Bacillus marinisedimentorum]